MSDGERVARDKALILAEGVMKWIGDCCDKVEIAGSIRREKETVGDIEIVCQPHNPLALVNTLDTLVAEGTITKALYRHVDTNKKETWRTRWGDRLKCFVLAGVNVELAIGDVDNFGYLHWLRTGPSDGNTFVMTRMKQEKAAMRFNDGYAWLVDYVGEQPTYSHKLSLPTEAMVFRTLGMDYINPLWRGEKIYQAEWKGVMPKYLLDEYRVREPKQKRLF
jgi:DNA polymerase/3'-5' exonuclease PolX